MDKLNKLKSKKLTLNEFKVKEAKRPDSLDLSVIAGGILGACHSGTVCVEFDDGRIMCVTYVPPKK